MATLCVIFVFGETGEIDGNVVCDSVIFVFDETGEIDGNVVCDSVIFVFDETGEIKISKREYVYCNQGHVKVKTLDRFHQSDPSGGTFVPGIL